jgi:LysR family transcriptional regulator, hydrogen peroxide-inducible genes activator
MELHQLRYFMAVCRQRSFTRAAQQERVAQPSLSQQIRKLEDEMGARLFDRLGRRIRLTPFGERFQEHARRVLDELEGARHEMHELLGLRRGRVAIGAIPTVAPYILPAAISAFARKYPGIKTNIREDLTLSLLAQLTEGELDIAILSLPIDSPSLLSEPVLTEEMLLAVPVSSPKWKKKIGPVSLRDIDHEPLLLLKDGHCFRDEVLEICRKTRLQPEVAFEGGQFDTLVGMVAAGYGITLLPKMAISHYKRSGVRFVPFVSPVPRRIVGWARSRDKLLNPGARAFIETLKAAICRDGKTGEPDKSFRSAANSRIFED